MLGAVLMGGRSRRFGSDKALAALPIDGEPPMGSIAIDALRAAGVDPVVAIGGDAGHRLGVVTVPDRRPGEGPLTGLISALAYAGVGRVVVVPCDVPRLRADDVARLLAASTDARAAVATIDGRLTPTLGCWPASWAREGQRRFSAGERRLRTAIEWGPTAIVELDAGSASDADTPDALRAAFEGLDDAKDRTGPATT